MLHIHPRQCVNCGTWELVCPIKAIFYEDDVPARWASSPPRTPSAPSSSEQLGAPGGAANTGPLTYDTDYIASYVICR